MFPLVELGHPGAQVLLLQVPVHGVHVLVAGRVSNQLAQGAAVFVAAGVGIQGCAGGALGDEFLELLGLHVHGVGQLQPVGLAAQTVGQLAADAPHLRQLFTDVNGQANGASAVVDGPGHALANPPIGIGRKLVAHGGVKFVDSPLEADGPFLNQIE